MGDDVEHELELAGAACLQCEVVRVHECPHPRVFTCVPIPQSNPEAAVAQLLEKSIDIEDVQQGR